MEFALHNTTENKFSGRFTVQIFDLFGTKKDEFISDCFADADSVTHTAAKHTFAKNELPDGVFFLKYTLSDSHGNFIEAGYSIHSTRDIPYEQLLTQPECKLDISLEENTLTIKNCGNTVASGVTLECKNDEDVFFSDGCMLILPGEEKTVSVDFQNETKPALFISGFGVKYREINFR